MSFRRKVRKKKGTTVVLTKKENQSLLEKAIALKSDRESYGEDLIDGATKLPYIRSSTFKAVLKGDLFRSKSSDALEFGTAIHEAIENYLVKGEKTSFLTKSAAKALESESDDSIVSLPRDNPKAQTVFNVARKHIDLMNLREKEILVEPTYVVPFPLIEKAYDKMKKSWCFELIEYLYTNKISIKVAPDMVKFYDGKVDVYDWKTTSKTSITDIQRDMNSFGQKLSIFFHCTGLEILGIPVGSINLLYIPKVENNPDKKAVLLSSPEGDVRRSKFLIDYLSSVRNRMTWKDAYERHISTDAVTALYL